MILRCLLNHVIKAGEKSHCGRAIHTGAVLCTKTAGRNSPSRKHDKPLTYEQFNQPFYIGVRKSWNSWNTTGFKENIRDAETAYEDLFIRKFVTGTWINLVESEIIIKRRANQIFLTYIINKRATKNQIYFLIGYTEEILSYLLKCIIKIELQTIGSRKDLVYRYI